ncbi:conjugal transfer protein, partial [Klebsiella pneumoniae]
NAFKKHHRFNPGKTFDMRKEFLGGCKAADPESISKILSKFGRVKG